MISSFTVLLIYPSEMWVGPAASRVSTHFSRPRKDLGMAAPLGPGAQIDALLNLLAQTVNYNHAQALAWHNEAQANHAQVMATIAGMGAPALVATITRTVVAIMQARQDNNHEDSGVPLTCVPRHDGSLPPHWPGGGFDRQNLIKGPINKVDQLLADYGQPSGPASGTASDRRASLAKILGTHPL